jgi:hypothetical protein
MCYIYGSGVESPYFKTEGECEKFRELIYEMYGSEFTELHNNVTCGKMEELYRTFKN